MNIFNHILPDDAILGIGPLMVEQCPDPVSNQLYGTRRYYFDLHLSAHTTQVRSDWFQPRTSDDDVDKMQQWKNHYQYIRKKIAAKMNEDYQLFDHNTETFKSLIS